MAVSSTERSLDGTSNLVRGGLPGSKADEWDLVPGVKGRSFPTGGVTIYGQYAAGKTSIDITGTRSSPT